MKQLIPSICYCKQIIWLIHALMEKLSEKVTKMCKNVFTARQYPITYNKSSQRHHFCTWLGTLATSAILTRFNPIKLVFVFNDVSPHSPWNTITIREIMRNGLMTISPQKIDIFSGSIFKTCQKNGENMC